VQGGRLERGLVPKRRRNPDGSLVTPLSPRQEEVLAKGRAALAAKVAPAPPRKGEPAADKGEPGKRRVEVVELSKASGGRAKASGRTKASRAGAKASGRKRAPATSSRAKAPAPVAKESGGGGFLERWFRET